MTPFGTLVAIAGAAIMCATLTISGYRFHNMLLKVAPRLGSLLPRDGGAICGLALGIGTVLGWLDLLPSWLSLWRF